MYILHFNWYSSVCNESGSDVHCTNFEMTEVCIKEMRDYFENTACIFLAWNKWNMLIWSYVPSELSAVTGDLTFWLFVLLCVKEKTSYNGFIPNKKEVVDVCSVI